MSWALSFIDRETKQLAYLQISPDPRELALSEDIQPNSPPATGLRDMREGYGGERKTGSALLCSCDASGP